MQEFTVMIEGAVLSFGIAQGFLQEAQAFPEVVPESHFGIALYF